MRSSWVCIALTAALGVSGCATELIAGYSLQAYQNATTLKADVEGLVAESTTPYSSHTSDVSALTLRLNEAYQFAKGEPANAISAKQWELLLNPGGHLYGRFVSLWQQEGQLSPTEAGNMTTLLDRAFDDIICLEANKQTATACGKPEALPGQ